MSVTTPAGWYPDPERADALRYWDGTAWTDHLAPGPRSGYAPTPPKVRPGLVSVWITAVLSILTFFVSWGSADGHQTTISFPIGVVFMVVCFYLVGQAQKEARLLGVALPGGYRAARITATVLGCLCVLSFLLTLART